MLNQGLKLPSSRFTAGALFATYSAAIFVMGVVVGFLAARL